MTTPRDALDGALGYIVDSDPQGHIEWPTADLILLALNAAGWTVARTQDARDGEALRLLQEALPGAGFYFEAGNAAPGGFYVWVRRDPDDGPDGGYDNDEDLVHVFHSGFVPTIADAAEAALSSIEVGE